MGYGDYSLQVRVCACALVWPLGEPVDTLSRSTTGRYHVFDGKGHMVSQSLIPTCKVSRSCGACQHVDELYAHQLARKDERVAQLFADDAFAGAELLPILGMREPYHYRGKVVSPFAPAKGRAGHEGRRAAKGAKNPKGGRRDNARGGNRAGHAAAGREILTGMYAAGTHELVNTDGCLVENEKGQQVIRAVRSIMVRHGIEPYDEDRNAGFVRHVVVRVGHESGEVLVTIVTNGDEFPASKSFCRELVRRCPFVTTVVQNVNTRQTNVILGQQERRLYGPGFILDTLCGLSFRISSQSFYQVNAVQTTVLYEQAMLMAGLQVRGEAGAPLAPAPTGAPAGWAFEPSVVDAYCGTGTIGLVAATRGAGQVVGVDSVESAIRDARLNARHNGVENARFVAADATEFMLGAAEAGERADIVFMDPPRAGSTDACLDAVAALGPQRVVYISCNPETQVRDLRHLAKRGYDVRTVQPVDMFPHTDHIETVALCVAR